MNRRSAIVFAVLSLIACGPQGAERQAAQLQAKARSERLAAAKTQAVQADAAAKALSVTGAADKGAALAAAAAALRDDGAKLDAGVQASPDFGAQASANTARLQTLTGTGAQRVAAASKIVLETNQVDVARSRYAVGLNVLIEAGVPVDDDMRHFCASPAAARFAAPCADALAVATAFEQAQVHAAVVFKAYKETVRAELSRQNDLIEKIGG